MPLLERKILILPEEMVERIDENRGNLGSGEFLDLCIGSRLASKLREDEPAE
jgi:hypothetical protein